MQPSEYFTAFRKYWLSVLVSALLGLAVAAGVAFSATPTYRATSSVFVGVQQGGSVTELAQGANYSQTVVQSFAELATMPIVLDEVIDELGLTTDARSLAPSIEVNNPLDTVIIDIAATTTDAQGAAELANAVAIELAATVDQVAPKGPEGQSSIAVRRVSNATVPKHQASPNKRLDLALGLAAGLLVGAVLAISRQLLDTRIRTAADVEDAIAAPILAQIPRFVDQSPPLMQMRPESVEAEAYRRLRTNLTFYTAMGDTSVIVVTSALSDEGKSTTAVNLALALAEQRSRVLLLDADLRRPSVAEMLGLEGTVGLTTVLIGRATVNDVVQEAAEGALDVLPAGQAPPNPLQLLDSAGMAELLTELRLEYDAIIIDSPPVLAVADTSVLARLADGALVVTRAGRSKTQLLRATVENLEAVGATVMGIAVNATRAPDAAMVYRRERDPSVST